MISEKIRQLEAEIRKEQNRIDNCSHVWGTPHFNPETKRVPMGYQLKTQGSDAWSEPTDYEDVLVNRWTRKCLNCGAEQHTNKQKPIIKGYEAEF
jgi:hypothetical protein